MQQIVVYTAITNKKDKLKPIPTKARSEPNINYIAYLDEETYSATPEEVLSTYDLVLHADSKSIVNPILAAKYPKIHPFRFPADKAAISLWLDGSIQIKDSTLIREFAERFLEGTDIATFAHPLRTCLYDEAEECILLGKDDPETIRAQVYRYHVEGMPRHFGLSECTIILRRNTREIRRLNKEWWEEIVHNSYRDQISFPYVLWKTGTPIKKIPGSVEDPFRHPRFTGNPWFSYIPHHRQ